MRKRTKFLIITVVAVLALTAGLTTAFASGSSGEQGGEDNGPRQTFISKVADNLEGVSVDDLKAAITTARQEMQGEALEQRLQKAVESGRLTEEEGDQIKGWWQERPDALENLGLPKPVRFCGERHNWMVIPVGYKPFGTCYPGLSQDRFSGTITDIGISEENGTITLAISEGNEVTFQYTSDTVFVLRGLTTVEMGQTAIAWCGKDADNNLVAKRVVVGLPLS